MNALSLMCAAWVAVAAVTPPRASTVRAEQAAGTGGPAGGDASAARAPRPSASGDAGPTTEQLVDLLGHADPSERQGATDKLAGRGESALPALEAARVHGSPEVAAQAGAIIRRIKAAAARGGGPAAERTADWVTRQTGPATITAHNVGPRVVEVVRVSPNGQWRLAMRRGDGGLWVASHPPCGRADNRGIPGRD
jgi:hypothetical protein